jgi:hypothetical protein
MGTGGPGLVYGIGTATADRSSAAAAGGRHGVRITAAASNGRGAPGPKERGPAPVRANETILLVTTGLHPGLPDGVMLDTVPG